MQYQPPEYPWYFDHARIPQEFAQVAAQRGCRRCVRCTEIGQQDAEAWRAVMFELRIADILYHSRIVHRRTRCL